MADPTTTAGDSIQAAPGSEIGAQRLTQTASEDAWKKTCVLSLGMKHHETPYVWL
jgi:hypothetical protein